MSLLATRLPTGESRRHASVSRQLLAWAAICGLGLAAGSGCASARPDPAADSARAQAPWPYPSAAAGLPGAAVPPPREAAPSPDPAGRSAPAAAHPPDRAPAEDFAFPGSDAFAGDEDLDALSAELDQTGRDPLEPMNRQVFRFNRGLETLVLDPVTRGYAWLVPPFGRETVRNLFRNLNTPAVLVNDLLQLRARAAAITASRFVINTTLGMGGLFDPAASFGMPAHESDFGQTLARAGLGSGPYIVVPVIGPTTVRDGVGTAVDTLLWPVAWVLPLAGWLAVGGSHGIAQREVHMDDLEALRENSVDYYAALRTAYLASRRAKLDEPEQDAERVLLPALWEGEAGGGPEAAH